ncbi:MAG: TIGR04283 family arsenosugar biosynthesis glycosyltransferase [Pseudomonadales bacterium]
MEPTISIILPVLNEAKTIECGIAALPSGVEVIIVDGGSADGTPGIAERAGGRVTHAERGRGRQMNAGAHLASGDLLVFLHADTRLPAQARSELAAFYGSDRAWGRFDVRLSGAHPMLRVISFAMNWRSRLTGICTGDQAIFVRKPVFEEAGGFADIALMEDIEFSQRMKRRSPPFCSRARVVTSSRRWKKRGIYTTMWLMWYLRLAYFLGASPETLARRYY